MTQVDHFADDSHGRLDRRLAGQAYSQAQAQARRFGRFVELSISQNGGRR
jgi:hypothetical protein